MTEAEESVQGRIVATRLSFSIPRFIACLLVGAVFETWSAASAEAQLAITDRVGVLVDPQAGPPNVKLLRDRLQGAKLEFTVRAPSPASSGPQVLLETADGRLEIAVTFVDGAPIPLIDIASVPGVLDSVEAYRKALDEVLRKPFAEALRARKLELLAVGAFSGAIIASRIDTSDVSKIKGVKIASLAPFSGAMLNAIGATQIRPDNLNGVAALLSSGQVAAVLFRLNTFRAPAFARFSDGTQAYEWPFGRLTPFIAVANRTWFEKRPEPEKRALLDAFASLERKLFNDSGAWEQAALSEIGRSVKVRGLRAEELKKLEVGDAFRPAWEQWKNDNIRRGGNQDAVWDLLQKSRTIALSSSGTQCPDSLKLCSDKVCRSSCK